jgi:septum formation protein
MSENYPRIILASASPRRIEMLRSLGLRFEAAPVTVDEAPSPGESPAEHVYRLSRTKALAVEDSDAEVVVGCDTVVVVDGEILGKPADTKDAGRMLRLLSGKTHAVVSGVALRGGTLVTGIASTEVTFDVLTDRQVDWYLATGEAMDKAGAYGIQGFAGLFVTGIKGSYANVVGLPLHLLPGLFSRLGFDFYSLLRLGG